MSAAHEWYLKQPGLSYSGMKDLAVSTLRYWHRHVNPARVEESPTPAQALGTAAHCLILEGDDAFNSSYVIQREPADYEGCLVTIEDLRGWLRDKGYQPKGTRKADIISQVEAIDSAWPIWDRIEGTYAQGREVLSKEFFGKALAMRDSVMAEPRAQELLANGEASKAWFVEHPEIKIGLKCETDWVTDKEIVDLKGFTSRKGRSIDQCVADAIWYEKYYWQAWLYTSIAKWSDAAPKKRRFVNIFVEFDEPHEVRIVEQGPGRGIANVYWERARVECTALMHTYKECRDHFGERPWRYAQEIEELTDEQMKGAIFA